MKASAFAAALRAQVLQISIDGQKTIETNNLAKFLEEKVPELEAAEKTDTLINVDFRVEHYKARLGNAALLLQSALDYAKNALNAAMLINAGAAVALLSLIGNLSSGRPVGSIAPQFASALLLFVLGVLCAAFAYGGAYLAQYFYAQNPDENDKTGLKYHKLTVGIVILSYVFFLWGGFQAYRVLVA